jgi:dolichyl-phosphate-mannose-protein mannosyltransferase
VTATLEAPAEEASSSESPLDADAGGTTEPPVEQLPVPAALRPWRDPNPRLGWLVTALVTGVAALTRFWALGFPGGKTFDEVYYATEAQELLRFGYEDNRAYMFIVHPPLGKWLIGLTSLLWGNTSIGWRIAPALAGTLAVLIMTRTVRRMLRSNLFGALAGLFLALDGVSVVLSRTALLDIFLQFFVLAGFAALVVDRDRMRARLAGLIADGADLAAGLPTLGPRPWRLLAGVMFGAACAVKWTALSFFVLFALLSLVWDRGALRSAGVRRPTRRMLRRSGLPAIGSLIAAPVATYLMCYLGWFLGENSWGRHWTDTHSASTRVNLFGLRVPFDWAFLPSPIRSLGSYTLQAYRFHESLYSGHPYRSSPWSWLVLGRPVDFFYDGSSTTCGASTCSREILLIGTPLMWWAFVPMLLWLAWHWVTTRDWRAGAVWVGFAAGWLVWFQDLRRTMFLFYTAPLVPFLIIGLTLGLGVLLGPSVPATTTEAVRQDPTYHRAVMRRRWGAGLLSVYIGLVIADFAYMWPIFTAGLMTYDQWHAHMWLPSWV